MHILYSAEAVPFRLVPGRRGVHCACIACRGDIKSCLLFSPQMTACADQRWRLPAE